MQHSKCAFVTNFAQKLSVLCGQEWDYNHRSSRLLVVTGIGNGSHAPLCCNSYGSALSRTLHDRSRILPPKHIWSAELMGLSSFPKSQKILIVMFHIISSLWGDPNFSEGVHILQYNKFRGSLFIKFGEKPILGGPFYFDRIPKRHLSQWRDCEKVLWRFY